MFGVEIVAVGLLCCGVLRCVAAYFSVLQRVVLCCRVLNLGASWGA